MNVCREVNCDEVVQARGLCRLHYQRLMRSGAARDPRFLVYPPGQGMRAQDVAERLGISYRQIDYWARLQLVRPTLRDASGSGTRRRYSENDVLRVKVLADLRAAGFTLDTAADLLDRIEAEDIDMERVEFVVTDGKVRIAERVPS